MKRTVIPAVALGLLVVAVAWWAVLKTGSAGTVAPGSPARDAAPPAPAAAPSSGVVAIPNAPAMPRSYGGNVAPASIALRDEIRNATDLRELYDKTKDLPDPTGERSYRMADAIFECSLFIDLPLEEMSRKLAVRPAAKNNPRREQALSFMAQRCKGFSGLGPRFADIQQELHARARAAAYPAEVGRSLRQEPAINDVDRSDAIAIGLLSSTADPDVLNEVSQYLAQRNRANAPFSPDGVTTAYAWGLLQCQYGADCGPQSRQLVHTCIFLGACELTYFEEAMRVQGASTAVMNNSTRLRDQLAERIANRDWQAVGFIPRKKPS